MSRSRGEGRFDSAPAFANTYLAEAKPAASNYASGDSNTINQADLLSCSSSSIPIFLEPSWKIHRPPDTQCWAVHRKACLLHLRHCSPCSPPPPQPQPWTTRLPTHFSPLPFKLTFKLAFKPAFKLAFKLASTSPPQQRGPRCQYKRQFPSSCPVPSTRKHPHSLRASYPLT